MSQEDELDWDEEDSIVFRALLEREEMQREAQMQEHEALQKKRAGERKWSRADRAFLRLTIVILRPIGWLATFEHHLYKWILTSIIWFKK